jgi:hypothetical protein
MKTVLNVAGWLITTSMVLLVTATPVAYAFGNIA